MVNVTVSIPENIKHRMERYKHINWSEVARRAFEEAALNEEKTEATEAIKKMRNESQAEWNGAQEIRRWRDAAK
jgi:desulfoferrodoxin (superoxide reductase-like protein)